LAFGNTENAMSDEMFFTVDNKSLRRGRRAATRTVTCRPCLVWPKQAPDVEYQGIIMDLSPYGMLIRMLGGLAPGIGIRVQLMRDEEFRDALADPLDAMVVRTISDEEGFTDHGVQIIQREIPKPPPRPIAMRVRRARPSRPKQRMHTIDITVGGPGVRRTGR
jgi:hypothetical protein